MAKPTETNQESVAPEAISPANKTTITQLLATVVAIIIVITGYNTWGNAADIVELKTAITECRTIIDSLASTEVITDSLDVINILPVNTVDSVAVDSLK